MMCLLWVGEVAQRSSLPISALRFYADWGLFVPARIDGSSGYRYYEADQLREATLLRHLRALDMPIADIQSFLAADPDAAQAALASHWKRLEQRFAPTPHAVPPAHPPPNTNTQPIPPPPPLHC